MFNWFKLYNLIKFYVHTIFFLSNTIPNAYIQFTLSPIPITWKINLIVGDPNIIITINIFNFIFNYITIDLIVSRLSGGVNT